jgi:hypothetical protein
MPAQGLVQIATNAATCQTMRVDLQAGYDPVRQNLGQKQAIEVRVDECPLWPKADMAPDQIGARGDGTPERMVMGVN